MTALRTFEDIEPGEVAHSGPLTVTREAIIAFAQMYDPQPFHLEEAAGAASLLGGLAASGWHTASIGMRLYYEGFVRHVASMGSPGLDEVRWLKPVRPGDQLSLVTTVGEKRQSASKPDRGFVAVALEVRNGSGEVVMTQRCPIIVETRDAAVPTAAAGPSPVSSGKTPMATPAADPMLTSFYDEVAVGHESRFGSQLFTPELITRFAKLYDPQYFHVDAEAAKRSHFGGLIASGWQTAAFWMKHYVAARRRSAEARLAAGLPAAVGGPSPGFTDLEWSRPVRAFETIAYGLKITGKRQTAKSGWAMITTENTGHASEGTLVFSFNGRLLWPMAPSAEEPR